MKTLGKYSLGIGDRFGHQGLFQLRALKEALKKGIEITPVWNKSNREHIITGTDPEEVRAEADAAVKSEGFPGPYFVDADHINNENVDRFIDSCDYYTIDVASFIGWKAEEDETETFAESMARYTGKIKIPGTSLSYRVTMNDIRSVAEKYLLAAIRAFDVYRKIEKLKGKGNFVAEISMDEVAGAQTPVDLFFILAMLAAEDIPVQTIAPKFTGRFNKGVDYKGDTSIFRDEFEADLLIINYAVAEFGLPGDLKISVHSGSDKFSIYPLIGSLIKKHNRGIHVKTAGTTWLEEVIGLAESGSKGLKFVKDIYSEAVERIEELTAPYSDVVEINVSSLPSPAEAMSWSGNEFAGRLRHIPGNGNYDQGMRQLMHVAYKLAAEKKEIFFSLLNKNSEITGRNVFDNLYERHICRLFDITP